MNRFIFGRGWVYEAEAGDDGAAGGGAGDAGADAGTGDGQGDAGLPDGGGDGAADGGAADPLGKKEEATPDMKSAIDVALGYKPKGGDLPEDKARVAAAATLEKHANGAPKKNEKGDELDDAGKVVKPAQAPKAKTAAELDLTAAEKQALGPKAQARFQEVIGTLKERDAQLASLTTTAKELATARDAILDVMKDARCGQNDLAGYLEFHSMLTSGDPRQLEEAVRIVENQRAALYKALGREPEGGGVDLLAEHADLKADVEESRITRERALEIVSARNAEAARQQQANQQRSQQQTVQQKQKVAEDALGSIEAWTKEISKSDLDYKSKEDILLPQIEGIMKEYPPQLWLATFKRLYAGIVVQKPITQNSGRNPLRPSGGKPGAAEPGSMLEAISQGLGYAKAE